MYRSQKDFGFTIMELIVVISIIGIVSAIAIPSFFSWLPNIHFRDATQNLQLDMNFAKMAATKRNATVHIRFVDTGACPASAAAFPNGPSSYTVSVENKDGTETDLRSVTLSNYVTLCTDCDPSGTAITYSNDINILPSGLPDILSTTSTCIINNNVSRKAAIAVNLTGNVTINPDNTP